uniref:FecR/PupR family sigma factor regulator n=1 Tax=Pseudomonas aeruginosa TaxID=287 RepID=UPI0020B15B84
MKTPSPADSDTLVQDAAHWCMRLHAEDLSEEERGEFQRWLAADPRHAAEYAEMEEIWALSELLPRTPAPELRNHAATRPLGRRRRGWKSQARAAALALLMLPTAERAGCRAVWLLLKLISAAMRPAYSPYAPFRLSKHSLSS